MHGGNVSHSPSSPADRRLSALVRHLEGSSRNAENGSIAAAPTSGSSGGRNSVFDHVVRAPEDPILGVILSLSLSLLFVSDFLVSVE